MHSGRPLSLASRSNREGLSRRVGIDAKAYKTKLAGASRQLSTGLPVLACLVPAYKYWFGSTGL